MSAIVRILTLFSIALLAGACSADRGETPCRGCVGGLAKWGQIPGSEQAEQGRPTGHGHEQAEGEHAGHSGETPETHQGEHVGPTPDAAMPLDAGHGEHAGMTLTVSSTPDPAVLGTNALHIMLHAADGTPMGGATVTVDLWMPAHGHGAPSPAIIEMGNGMYEASDVVFTMSGDWELTFEVTMGDRSEEHLVVVNVVE